MTALMSKVKANSQLLKRKRTKKKKREKTTEKTKRCHELHK